MSLHPEPSDRRADGSFDQSGLKSDPVFYFDLEPVLERAQYRLKVDRERLKLICERHIQSIAASNQVFFSTTGFYLFGKSGADSQALAEQINLSLLQLFFGSESLQSEQVVKMFRRATLEQASRLLPAFTPPQSNGTDDGGMRLDPAEPFPEGFVPQGEERPKPSGALSRGLEFAISPVVDFQKGQTASFFCTPFRASEHLPLWGYQSVAGSLPDTLELDAMLLEQAGLFTQKLVRGGIYAGVGASVSYETLARQKSRDAYQRLLRNAQTADNPLLILAIECLPKGIPATRLADIIHCLRPLIRRIFVHLPDASAAATHTGLLGGTGFVMTIPPRTSRGQSGQIIRRLLGFCASQAAVSCIDQIDDDDEWNLVRESGVRFGVSKSSPDELLGLQKPPAEETSPARFQA
jgi:hypothetical protein